MDSDQKNFSATELKEIIETLTNSKALTLDEMKCKQLKLFCKQSTENVNVSYCLIWSQLEKVNSQIRLKSVQIMDLLFYRSAAFRELLISRFYEFAELSLGINPKCPLPPPIANRLKLESSKYIKRWHNKFGVAYKKFELAFNFLKNCKNIKFDDIDEWEEEREKERLEVERTTRLDAATEQFVEMKNEVQSCLSIIRHCFNLILPSPSEFDVFSVRTKASDEENEKSRNEDDDSYGDANDEESYVHVRNVLPRIHGVLGNGISVVLNFDPNKSLSVNKSADNVDVLASMDERATLLTRKCLPSLQQVLEVFEHCGASDEVVDDAIKLKDEIKRVLEKVGKFNVVESSSSAPDRDASDESDYSDFIEVPPNAASNNEALINKIGRRRASERGVGGRSANSSTLNPSSSGLGVSTGKTTSCHEPQVLNSWKCRTKMSNGKLCFRSGKIKCPFHGPIRPRDREGRPNGQSSDLQPETVLSGKKKASKRKRPLKDNFPHEQFYRNAHKSTH